MALAANDYAVDNEWLGYGDGISYFKLEDTEAGRYSLTLENGDGAVNVYFMDANGTTIKSMTVAANKTRVLSNVLVRDDVSYVAVEATDKGRTANQNGTFSFEVVRDQTFEEQTEVRSFNDAANYNGWLGLGDGSDSFSLDLAAASNVRFELSLDENAADYDINRISATLVNTDTGKKVSLKKSTFGDGFAFSNTALAAGSYELTLSIGNEKKYAANYAIAYTALV